MAKTTLVFLFLVANAFGQKKEGDTCTDEYTNSVGRCTQASACESARVNFQQNGIRPTFCAYTFEGALVCCSGGSNILQAPGGFDNRAPADTRPVWGSGSQSQTPSVATRPPPPVDTRPVWGSGRPQAQTPATKRPPPPVDNRPVWGGSGISNNNGPQIQQNDGRRISERKCEDYSKDVVETVDFIVLLPDAPKMSIKTAKCEYSGVELIVGGEKTRLGEFPHMAAIGWTNSEGSYTFSCGGSLISPRFVLTAGHCTRDPRAQDPVPAIVRLGDQNIDPSVQDGAKPIEVPIKNIHRHPEYNPPVRYNDIALLELRADVSFETNIRPACLWTRPDFGEHIKAVATGWGVTNTRSQTLAKELQKVSLTLLENDYCGTLLADSHNRKWWGFTPTQMCAGELRGGMDTCQGDSGSPLQVASSDNQCIFYVMGVVSFGKKCAVSGQPAIYTRVSGYLDWIEGIVWPGE